MVLRGEGACPLDHVSEEELVFAESEERAWQMLSRLAYCGLSRSDSGITRERAIIMRLAVINYQRQGWLQAACSQRQRVERVFVPSFASKRPGSAHARAPRPCQIYTSITLTKVFILCKLT